MNRTQDRSAPGRHRARGKRAARRRGLEIVSSGRRYVLGRRDGFEPRDVTYYVWEKRKPRQWVEHESEVNARQELWWLEERARVERRGRWTRAAMVAGLVIAYGIAAGVVLYVNDGPGALSTSVPARIDRLGAVAAGRYLNPEGSFTFRAPDGWFLESSGPTTELSSPDRTVSISMTTAPDGAIGDASESVVHDLADAWREAEIEPAQTRNVGALPAISVSGTATDVTGEPIRFLSVVVDSGEHNHAISVAVPRTWDPVSFMPAIEELLSSFKPLEAPDP